MTARIQQDFVEAQASAVLYYQGQELKKGADHQGQSKGNREANKRYLRFSHSGIIQQQLMLIIAAIHYILYHLYTGRHPTETDNK